jgi:DHA2 family methylenomycin A resistance protein-like MFS transporter
MTTTPVATSAAAAPYGGLSADAARRFMITICIASVTGPMNYAMLSVALPTIADDLHVSVATAGWLFVVPSLASSSLQSIGGRLGDTFGYRRLFVLGALAFVVASAVAASAPTFWTLVAGRTLMMLGSSAMQPNSGALVRVHMPAARRASAYGTMVGAMSLSFAAGPLLGGVLVATIGWRSLFVVAVPFTILAALLALRWIPNDPPHAGGRRTLDGVGAALWSLSVIAIVLPLNLAGSGDFSPARLSLAYLGAGVLLFAFISWELRQAEPVVQVRLFLTRTFRAAAASESSMNITFFPIALALAVFMEDFQSHSATLAGLVLAVGSTSTVLGSIVGGRLADKLGRRRPALVGRCVAVLGTLPLLTMDHGTSPLVLGFWLLIMSLGSGLSSAVAQTAAVESAPRRYSGMATGVFTTSANLGGIIGIALTSAYLGDSPGLSAFRVIFALYVATTIVGSVIATRLEPWPANEDDARPALVGT